MLEGFQEALSLGAEGADHLVPTCLEGFLAVGYGEAKNALAHFDRAARALDEAETRLATLKNQAKPDLSLVGQQEQLVQQLATEFDAEEERAYDTLFRVTSEAESVLVRAMSMYLRSWADYLAGMASSLESACDALQQEKTANPNELVELVIPTVNFGSASSTSTAAPVVHVPARRITSTPPEQHASPFLSSSPPSFSPSDPHLSVVSPPHRSTSVPTKAPMGTPTMPKQTGFKVKKRRGEKSSFFFSLIFFCCLFRARWLSPNKVLLVN